MMLSLAAPALAADNFGQFKGEVVAKFLRDGRNIQLTEPFGYVDPAGRQWDVPAGMITNGASVPQFFWTAFPPFTGSYRSAAVIHDYYCETKTRSWEETHEVFYLASRAAGVSEAIAKALYAAVYHFGPRWGSGARMRGLGADAFTTPEQQGEFFKDLDAWIARDNPSLDEIARRLDSGPVPAGIGSKGRARRLSPE
jgi:hypothetical protein